MAVRVAQPRWGRDPGCADTQGSSRGSQPWAVLRNPFGIRDGVADHGVNSAAPVRNPVGVEIRGARIPRVDPRRVNPVLCCGIPLGFGTRWDSYSQAISGMTYGARYWRRAKALALSAKSPVKRSCWSSKVSHGPRVAGVALKSTPFSRR